jgi:hypothetical protein
MYDSRDDERSAGRELVISALSLYLKLHQPAGNAAEPCRRPLLDATLHASAAAAIG